MKKKGQKKFKKIALLLALVLLCLTVMPLPLFTSYAEETTKTEESNQQTTVEQKEILNTEDEEPAETEEDMKVEDEQPEQNSDTSELSLPDDSSEEPTEEPVEEPEVTEEDSKVDEPQKVEEPQEKEIVVKPEEAKDPIFNDITQELAVQDALKEMAENTETGEAQNMSIQEIKELYGEIEEETSQLWSSRAANKPAGGAMQSNEAQVTGLGVVKTKTGTAPFNSDNKAGNDSSDDNDIVRSFDEISYTLGYTTAVKDSSSFSSFTSGDMYVKLKLPVSITEAKFLPDAMQWLDEADYDTSTNTLTGIRHLTNGNADSAIPGAGTLSVVVSVRSMKNGSTLRPVFSAYMIGNSTSEEKSVTAKAIKVSSAPKFDVELSSGGIFGNRAKVNMAVKIGDPVYGIKGAELAGDPVTFKIHTATSKHQADDQWYTVPGNKYVGLEESGDSPASVDATASGEDALVTIYSIPDNLDQYIGSDAASTYLFVQKTLLFNTNIADASVNHDDYYVQAIVNDFSGKTVFGNTTDQQTNVDNDHVTFNTARDGQGEYMKEITFMDVDKKEYLPVNGTVPDGTAGTAKAYLEDTFNMRSILQMKSGSADISKFTYFTKFSPDYVIPTGAETEIDFNNLTSSSKLEISYIGKDGNWSSEEEMQTMTMFDIDKDGLGGNKLNYYSSLSELTKKGKTCVGILYEGSGDSIVVKNNDIGYGVINFDTKMKVKNEGNNVGNVTQFINEIKIESTNGEAILINERNKTIPKYGKTTYDADGNLTGGHLGGWGSGQSLRIIDVKTSIKKTIDQTEQDGKEKSTYDLAGGQNQVDFCLQPSAVSYKGATKGKTVQITVVDTLPAEMSYIKNSAKKGGTYKMTDYATGKGTLSGGTPMEPTIENEKKLTWKFNVTVGSSIPAIHYSAKIQDKTKNGSKLTNSATIQCAFDGRPCTAENGNKASKGIITVSLNELRQTKKVDQDTIDIDGSMTYTLKTSNTSSDPLSNVSVVDVLPNAGDGRGSSFHGTYSVSSAKISWTDILPTVLRNAVYYTTDKLTPNTTAANMTSDVTWKKATVSNTGVISKLPGNVTGIGIQGLDIGSKGTFSITVTLQTSGNNSGDQYYNDSSVYCSSVCPDGVPVRTTKVVTSVQSITHIIKADSEGNAIAGAKLKLLDSKKKLIEQWTSATTPHVLKGLAIGETYTLQEEAAPDGFICAKDVTFQIVSGSIQVVTMNDLKFCDLTVTKRIKESDIVWENGNPTFIFKVTGKDLIGKKHTYSESVEFTKDYVDQNVDSDGYTALSAKFENVPEGTNYQITEASVSRFYLIGVTTSDSNVTIKKLKEPVYSEKPENLFQVDVNLQAKPHGTDVTFTNKKQKWDRYSHNSVVSNKVERKQ